VTVFELQDSSPLPPGRRVQLADGSLGVLVWEYEPRGGHGDDRLEAIGVRVSILYQLGKRRRYVTAVYSLELLAQSVVQREVSIVNAANDDCKIMGGSLSTPGLGVAPTQVEGNQCAVA